MKNQKLSAIKTDVEFRAAAVEPRNDHGKQQVLEVVQLRDKRVGTEVFAHYGTKYWLE